MPVTLGSFALRAPVGRGGMGEVWAAEHVHSGVTVAIKLVLGADDAAAKAFLREVHVLAALRHPNVLRPLDAGRAPAGGPWREGTPWLATEFAPGGTVADQAPTSWDDVRSVLIQTLAGLAHAHAHRVVHRDVKPTNLLHLGGRVVLADFGLAHTFGGVERRVAGTPGYMAPEQLTGRVEDHGPATDLYAVGCLAWALVTGAPPFWSEDTSAVVAGHLSTPVPRLPAGSNAPDALQDWLDRSLAKDPGLRFASAAEALAVLSGLGGSDPLGVRIAPPTLETVPFSPPSRAPAEDNGLDDRTFEDLSADRHVELPCLPLDEPDDPALAGAGQGLLGARDPALVGREREQELLWEALGRVVSGRTPEVVVVSGPSGAGRRRLASWVARGAAEHGIGPWVRVAAGEEPSSAVVAELGRGDPRVRRLASFRAAKRSGEDRVGAAVSALGNAAGTGAAVLWLDGVDAPGWDFVRRLFAVGAPVLVVAGTDGAGLPELPVAPLLLELGPLGDAPLRLLTSGWVGLEGTLSREVERSSRGLPGRVAALVRDLAAREQLVAGPGGLALAVGSIPVVDEPDDDVRRAGFAALLAAAPPAEALALGLAATLGAEVEYPALEWLWAHAGLPEPTATLDRALRLGALEALRGGLRFAHAGIRTEVLEHVRAAGRWEVFHAACAAWCRQGETPDREALARHLFEAGRWAEAHTEGQAATRALLTAGEARVGDLLDRQEEALHHLAAPAEDRRWLELRFDRARAAYARGEWDVALTAFREIAGVAALRGWAGLEGMALRGWGRLVQADADVAVPLAQRALARAEALRDRQEIVGCRVLLAEILQHRDPAAAADLLRQVLVDEPASTSARTALVLLALAAGRSEEVSGHLEALSAADLGDHPRLRAEVENLRGEVARKAGDLDRAARHYRRAVVAYRSVGRTGDAAYPTLNLALVRALRGDERTVRQLAEPLIARDRRRAVRVFAQAALLSVSAGQEAEALLSGLEAELRASPLIEPDLVLLLELAAAHLPEPTAARARALADAVRS
jgi:hypothetical protein